MRLILFALFLLSLLGWGAYSTFIDEDASLLNGASEMIAGEAVDSAERVANYAHETNKTQDVVHPPIITQSYTFKHRPLPPNDFFQLLGNSSNSDGRSPLSVLTDSETRTCILVGHMDEVTQSIQAVKLADAPANACHAKAWIVFVRKDKSDGFDLGLELTATPARSSFVLGRSTFSGLYAIHNVEVTLDALRARGLVEVVQAPTLRITSGQEALIETGDEVAVPVVTVNQSVTQTTVEYRKVGLSLAIQPQFLADQKMRLHITQSNGLVSQFRDVGGYEVPELTNQTLKTTVDTKVGELLVLGGVETSTFQRSSGWLSRKTVKESGFLYVILATYSNIPVAEPVLESVPAGSPLLPPKSEGK